jgi:excisionase family DNA binding protein
VSNEDRGTLQVTAELLTVQEVAALCRVSTNSVYRAIQHGELEAEEIFGCLRIRRGAPRSTGESGVARSSGG